MNFVEDINENHQDHTFDAESNLRHLVNLFAGYRAFITNDEELRPYSPGSARQVSFEDGIALAKEDLGKSPEKFTIEEIKNYVRKRDSIGDVFHFLNAKKIREANEPEEDTQENE